jgi:hypothetical protein
MKLKTRWAENVASTVTWKMLTEFSSANVKGREQLGDIGVDETVIIKWMLKKLL